MSLKLKFDTHLNVTEPKISPKSKHSWPLTFGKGVKSIEEPSSPCFLCKQSTKSSYTQKQNTSWDPHTGIEKQDLTFNEGILTLLLLCKPGSLQLGNHSPKNAVLTFSKLLYQAKESSLVPLCLLTIQFLQKT